MKKQLIGIFMALLLFIVILNAGTAVLASPLTMILFGAYLMGIVWYSRRGDGKVKEYPLSRPGLN